MKILIVEDNRDDAFLISEFLRMDSTPHQIDIRDSFKCIPCCLERFEFDVILLDCNLPDSFGLATIEKVKKITDIPIVSITGYQGHKPDEYIAAGAVGYVEKNRIDETFPRVLRDLLEH